MSSQPEFGHYALPAAREALRRRADKFGANRLGRTAISLYRKRAFAGFNDPFDVEIMQGVKARLYPRSNRCEKRAFAGIQIWDAVERAALAGALDANKTSPFVFLDVGANIGLYSLILAAYAKKTGGSVRIIAFEPDPENRARLMFNIKASAAQLEVLPFAISDTNGTGYVGGGEQNRGSVHLQDQDDSSVPVEIKTLRQVCLELDIVKIHAMKMDIEGYDERALGAFFTEAPQSLWPELLILETGRAQTTSLLELCQAQGYRIEQRNGINSVLTRTNKQA